MSGNTPDTAVLKDLNKESEAFPNALVGGFHYRNYPQDGWIPSKKIAKNIQSVRNLSIKPNM